MFDIPSPDYPTLFLFEVGEWWDYAMLVVVTVALAGAAWLAQRFRWAAVAFFIVIPVVLTVFWWPYSTAGTKSAGWFPIVKQYSALLGSLSLVALQYFPALRSKKWYLCLPPAILAVNILEAVIRDFQCFFIHGVDPTQGIFTWGGPWNILNGVAGILNLLAISGWVGIFVAKGKSKAIIWGDLTLGWIIAYDLWNLAYVYNCLADRAWYSGVALLAACTLPVLTKWGRGSWIQYRAYTLTIWSAVVLSFPSFMHEGAFVHEVSHNPWALLSLSLASFVANVVVFAVHVRRIIREKRNPLTQEVYVNTPEYQRLIDDFASEEVKAQIRARA